MQRVNRNDPCPCGSGKKYKHCCLSKVHRFKGKEELIWKRLEDDLFTFLKRDFSDQIEKAHECFWGGFDPEEHLKGKILDFAVNNFLEWCLYDWRVDLQT